MKASVILLLALAALASSAPTDKSCCGPLQWEAMAVASAAYGYTLASSRQISGSLAVDHKHNLAALVLLSKVKDSNITMGVISNNSSPLLVYFLIHNRRQADQQADPAPTCASYVLKNVVNDLTSNCFPADSLPVDRLTAHFGQSSRVLGSIPINMRAYDYAGLAGLFAVRVFADATSCMPVVLGLSSEADQGPRMSFSLMDMVESSKEPSFFQLPSMCSEDDTVEIDMPKMMASRRGPMSEDSDWIEQTVMEYAVKQLMPNSGEYVDLRRAIKLDEALEGSTAEVIMNAAALRKMLQYFSDFIGPEDSSESNGTDAMDVEKLIKIMIGRKLISEWSDDSGDDDWRNDDDDNDDDLLDLVDIKILSMLMQRMGLTTGDRQLPQLIVAIKKIKISKNMLEGVLRDFLVSELVFGQRPRRSNMLKLAVLRHIADRQDGMDMETLLKIMLLRRRIGN